MAIDYYAVLGVEKGSDDETIKKAYRNLAKKYHPDKNPGDKESESKFKEIQEAYDVLVKSPKKSQPETPFQGGGQVFQDIFDNFFNQRSRQGDWGHHIEMEVVIDFLESAKGCSRSVSFDKRSVCASCKGTRANEGKDYKVCVVCDGRGKTYHHHGDKGSFLRFETSCVSCKGSGKVISNFCTSCDAKGYDVKPAALDLKIPAGINDGMKICARGEGDVGPNGAGNLFCTVRVKSHPLFQREGINLLVKVPITYSQAVLGGDITVPCLDGVCKFKLPPGTKSGATFRMGGYGFVLPDDDESARGDLLVKTVIDVPVAEDVSERYRAMMKELSELEKEFPGDSRKNFNKNLKESEN